MQGNNLWVPKEGESGDSLSTRIWPALGVELGGWSFGAQFGDLNNDGTPDLYPDQWLRLARPRARATGTSFRSWPAGTAHHLGRQELAAPWRAQPRRLSAEKVWLNDGAGQFIDVAQAVG